MTRRVWVWIAHVVAWSLLVTGVTVLFLKHRATSDDEPERANPATYAAMPFMSTLSLTGPDRGRVGSVFRFSAEGFSNAGVAAVTLYDGARAMDTMAPRGSDPSAPLEVVLPALSVGRHTVHAKVTDKDGKVSDTAPVSILVGVAPGEKDLPVEVPVLPDETPADVAERIGVPAANLLTGARQLKPTQQIPVGLPVFAVVPPDAGVDLLTGKDVVVVPGLDKGGFALEAKADGCGVSLQAKADGEVTFYRGGGSSAGWIQLGRPQQDGRTDVEDLSPGTHVFFARAGKLDSGQVAVTVPEQCAQGYGWTGNASIVDGELILPEAANGVFALLSVDGKTWRRLPASQDEFISAGKHTSIAHLLPSLAGRRLQLQVFRISKDVPLPVGNGDLRLPSDRSIADVIGEPSAVALSVDGKGGPANGIQLESQDKTVGFTWAGASRATTRVRWQVLTSRSSTGDLNLNPPGLLASGVSEASEDGALGGRAGTFSINTADIPRADRDLPAKPGKPGKQGTTAVALKPPSLGGALSDKPAFGAIVPVSELAGVVQPVELPVEGSTVYIRVIAETGPSAASPSVFLTLPRHQSATSTSGVDFNVNAVKVDAGRAPNEKYVGCLKVKVPWGPGGVTDPTGGPLGPGADLPAGDALVRYVASQFYKSSGVYCPGAFPPPKGCDAWYCQVVEFVVDAAGVVVDVVVQLYSLVAYAYNGVISTVVKVLTKLNPICAVLGAAGEGEAADDCTTVTGFATQAAVSAVLASVGLPPSLPSAEELEAIASGELDKLAVEVMKGLGVPCDAVTPPAGFDDALATAGEQLDSPVVAAAANPCLAVASLLIGSVRKGALASAEQALADASGLPAFPTVEGFSMEADPRGKADPLKVDVSITARDSDADTSNLFCEVQVRNPGKNTGNSGIGPFPSFRIQLKPTGAGGRTFTGGGAAYPFDSPTKIQDLQGESYDVAVRSEFPSRCQFADAVEEVTIRRPDQ